VQIEQDITNPYTAANTTVVPILDDSRSKTVEKVDVKRTIDPSCPSTEAPTTAHSKTNSLKTTIVLG